jgi:hypothetical protein
MTKDEVSQARRTLAHLLEELRPLVEELVQGGPMLKGYLDSRPRSCGKPGCRCAEGERHPAWVLRIPEGLRSRSRSIPEAVYGKLEPLTEEYRRFRQAAVRWRKLVRKADDALRVLESGRLVDPDVELERMRIRHGK